MGAASFSGAEHITQKYEPSCQVPVCDKPEPQLSLASKTKKVLSQQEAWRHGNPCVSPVYLP